MRIKLRCKERATKFETFQAHGTKLPFDANSFDAVTCQTVLIHVEDPVKVLLEMKRVLHLTPRLPRATLKH
jgi:ubiquinone/menaquinone biosynthesis C-methylase UbiE